MPPEIQKALNAAAGEVGAKTLRDAVQKHAGGKGVARLREIRADIKNEMGGNVVRGARADEMKKRLQAEGLLPNGKAKSEEPLKLKFIDEKNGIAAKNREWQADLKSQPAKKEDTKILSKPDPLYGAWETDQLKKFRDGIAKDPVKYAKALKQAEGELARRANPKVPEKKGSTDLLMDDISRMMRGESPQNVKMVSASGEVGAGAVMNKKSQIAQLQSALGLGAQTRSEVGRDLEGLKNEAVSLQRKLNWEINLAKPGSRKLKQLLDQKEKVDGALAANPTNANASTQYARESAKDTDKQINKNGITQEVGKRGYNWDSSSGSGSKKLGSGAYGTVMQEPNKGSAVKRGDIGVDEARLIDRIGKADLGPTLKAAQLDGETDRPNTRLGRLAMSVVPGKPIGNRGPGEEVNGVKISDAYWKARADLHRMGIAHNDMHIDNVLVDKTGKGRFVDMGLAQESPKAALAEAMGAFQPTPGNQAVRGRGAMGQGDWQVRRWSGTGGELLGAVERIPDRESVAKLNAEAPLLGRIRDNKNELQYQMRRDGFSKDDIATVMDHGIRSPLDTYNRGVWERMSDEQASNYINLLYDGI
jgi:hypothetical protein